MSTSENLDWSPEYCLACDRQTDGTAYCSESCRLAEYERNNSSSESSPSTSHTYRSQPVPNSFHLPSAYDFSKTTSRPAVYSRAQSTPQVYTQQRPVLTPSSSQTSLMSLQSTNSNLGWNADQGQLSEESKQALRAYASSFDQSRYRRRQSTY